MRKHIVLLTMLSIVIFGVLLTASCNNASKPPEASTAATDTMAKAEGEVATKSSIPIEELFHILWTDTATFLNATRNANKKMTFKYFLINADSLTLHGWSNDNGATTFDKDSLVLWVGRASEYEIGPGSYFSNQVLKKNTIKSIRDEILKEKPESKPFVVFIPNLGDDGLIEYRIIVTDRDPKIMEKSEFSKEKLLTLPPTNPSPPRGSN